MATFASFALISKRNLRCGPDKLSFLDLRVFAFSAALHVYLYCTASIDCFLFQYFNWPSLASSGLARRLPSSEVKIKYSNSWVSCAIAAFEIRQHVCKVEGVHLASPFGEDILRSVQMKKWERK